MNVKKTELAKRLKLRYATLLDWEKNRPEVYERLVLSYEYERMLEEMVTSFDDLKKRMRELQIGGK